MTNIEFLALAAVLVLVACAAGIGALVGIIAQSGPTAPSAGHSDDAVPADTLPAR